MRGLAEIKLVGKKPSIASMVTNHLPIASLNECIFLLYAAGPLSSFSMYSMPSFVPSHLCHLCACVGVCVCLYACVCVRGRVRPSINLSRSYDHMNHCTV